MPTHTRYSDEEIEKLKNNSIVNYESFPDIFGLTERQILDVMDAVSKYSCQYWKESTSTRSYHDWLKMYNSIHRESTYESAVHNWLACIRWMNESDNKLMRSLILPELKQAQEENERLKKEIEQLKQN